MPIKFLQNKQYVVISHQNRKGYYQRLKKAYSFHLDIMSLEELEKLFLSSCPKERFVDKEIIISGYYTKGDLIAHYLNSLSGNMIIGYELETEAKEKIPVKVFINPEEEIYSCAFNAMKNNEKNPAKPIYFMNLNKKERGFIGANFPFITILDSYVNPFKGEIFIPHLDKLQYSSKEDAEALKRTLLSPQLTYVTECRKN